MIKLKNEEFKYYIMLDEGGKSVSPGYREDGDVPEDIKSNGFLATKAEFEKLLNGYLRDPMTGEFKEIPPYVPTLDELKTAKLAEIDMWTAEKITGGFISSCSGEPVRYDSDKDTQLTMQGIALNVSTERFANEYPLGCPVRGYKEGETEKTIQYLNAAQVYAWCADLSSHIGACKQQGWIKQAQVEAALSKEDLEAIILD
jgi:hypothetical protein